jgi:hypothetical protein
MPRRFVLYVRQIIDNLIPIRFPQEIIFIGNTNNKFIERNNQL